VEKRGENHGSRTIDGFVLARLSWRAMTTGQKDYEQSTEDPDEEEQPAATPGSFLLFAGALILGAPLVLICGIALLLNTIALINIAGGAVVLVVGVLVTLLLPVLDAFGVNGAERLVLHGDSGDVTVGELRRGLLLGPVMAAMGALFGLHAVLFFKRQRWWTFAMQCLPWTITGLALWLL
jgi:hypothetical protein